MLRRRCCIAPLLVAAGAAWAEGPRIALEYEREKDQRSGIHNNALTLQPGWQFAKGSFIDRVELLIDHNEDAFRDENGGRARENKLFLRVRHSGKVLEALAYYVRGGVGRSFNGTRNFNYAYVEPGLKYAIAERWEWTFGVRQIDSSRDGQRVRKLLTGPSYSLDEHNEIELRYASGRGDKQFSAWSVSYAHKF